MRMRMRMRTRMRMMMKKKKTIVVPKAVIEMLLVTVTVGAVMLVDRE